MYSTLGKISHGKLTSIVASVVEAVPAACVLLFAVQKLTDISPDVYREFEDLCVC